MNIEAGKKGYTEDGLADSEKSFGLFLLETSDMKKLPRDIFCDYKSRWAAETFYNYVDNTIDFNALYQRDYCRTQGLAFIIQIAGMVYHELREIVDRNHLSQKTVMGSLKGLKLSMEKGEWKMKNTVKGKRELAEMMGVTLTPDISSPA